MQTNLIISMSLHMDSLLERLSKGVKTQWFAWEKGNYVILEFAK